MRCFLRIRSSAGTSNMNPIGFIISYASLLRQKSGKPLVSRIIRLQIWIVSALCSDRRGVIMPGIDGHFIRKRQQLLLDAANQRRSASLREIRPSDRLGEQRIPGKKGILIGKIITAATHRVSRCKQYPDMKSREIKLLLILQKYICVIGRLRSRPSA